MSLLGIFLAILFAAIGGVIEGGMGFLTGLFLGYALGAVIQLSAKLNSLSRTVIRLEKLVYGLRKQVDGQAGEAPQQTPTDVMTPAQSEVATTEVPRSGSSGAPAPETTPPARPPTPAPKPTPTPQPGTKTASPQVETIIDNLIGKVYHFFTDGNVVAKIGVLIVFVGVGMLIKYAYEHSMLPIELRVAGFGVLGIIMVVFGWRLRNSKRIYALLLQGGGVGVLYLTVFGAAKLYGLMPLSAAFLVMVALVVLASILSVLQDAKYLALYSAAGGFLAPVLASTGSGSHVMLFSYYAILNLGIVGIAWFRSWRELNLLGFVFTFVIGSLWGAKFYRPEYFNSVEPFLILFFVFFVAIAVLFAFRQPPQLKGYVDSTLVFGVPIIGFALQAALVREFQYGMAFSALAMSGFYIILATSLWRRGPQGMRLMTESFLALGVVFGTLAIPLALDGLWTAAAWALEGAAIVWIGVRQSRVLARLFGLILQFGSGYFFLIGFKEPSAVLPVLNGIYLGGLTIALSGLFSSYYLYKHSDVLRDFEKTLHIPLLVWGIAWWLGSGLHEIDKFVPGMVPGLTVSLMFVSASALLWHAVESLKHWRPLRFAILGHLYAMILFFVVIWLFSGTHSLARLGAIAWPMAFFIQYFLLYRYRAEMPERVLKWQHVISFWLVVVFVTQEMVWVADANIGGGAWRDMMMALTPAVIMLFVFTQGHRLTWPVAQHRSWYASTAAWPVMLVLALAAAGYGLLHGGNPWPVQYLPILNPIDLVVIFLLYLLLIWRMQLIKSESWVLQHVNPNVFNYLLAGIGFLWLNGMIARTIHHWFGIPHELENLLRSIEFQATISVVWTIVALTAMVMASRRGHRNLWFVGLGLFIVVAAKLFLVDISTSDAMAMSISITVVGILAVVFGYYLSPLPPRKEEQ